MADSSTTSWASRRPPRSTTAAPTPQALQQVFADNFIELGGTITPRRPSTKDQKDMSPVLKNIATSTPGPPGVIYMPIFVAGLGFLKLADPRRRRPRGRQTVGRRRPVHARLPQGSRPAAVGHYLSSPNFTAFQVGLRRLPREARGQVRRHPSRSSTLMPTTRRTSCSPRSRRSPSRTPTVRCRSRRVPCVTRSTRPRTSRA